MELRFELAGERDWKTVAALEKSVSGTKLFFAFTSEGEIRDYIRKSRVYIILLGSKPVGVVAYEMKGSDYAQIEGVIVRPEHQGKGIATKAVGFALGKLEGVKRLDLTVHPENTPAIRLYEKFGFKTESRKENYFGDGEPRLILARVKK